MSGPQVRRRLRDDTGSVTLWMVFATTIVFAVCGLVFDGGALISSTRRANNDAEAAARAGAQAIDETVVLTGGPAQLDPTLAVDRAEAFLAANGWTGSATATTTDVTVTITRIEAMTFLQTLGIADRAVTGTATARPQTGFAGP